MSEAIMTPERIEKARRYRVVRYSSMLTSVAVSAVYLLALILGGSAALWRLAPHPVLFIALMLLGYSLVQLPVDYYSHLQAGRFGLTVQTAGSWLLDQLKGFLVGLVLNGTGALLLLWSWQTLPHNWYLYAAGGAFMLNLLVMFVAPVLIMPLFNKYRPLGDGELKDRLMRLSEKAGVRVRGVFVSDVSKKDTRLNASLSGLGSTRRIVLYDTLVDAMSTDEVEIVLGHEMGHHVYGHIAKLVFMSGGFLAAVLIVAGFAAPPISGALGLGGLTPAALPLVALLLAAVGVPLLPVLMAISRQWERDCDRFALTLTGNSAAFIGAFRKLADRNLADIEPPRWAYYFLYSHPPVPERVAMAERFALER